ncbi:MAG TPA: ABC transporter permease [Methanotrichaceae archaeon]|nr:ABC transporter permease [Methanotrichaceae archaeon]
MDMLDYVLVNINADRRRVFMSSLGIVIGVVSIVALISVSEGLYGGMSERFGDMDMDLINVRPGSDMGPEGPGPGERPASTPEEPAEFDDKDVKLIENVLGVKDVYPLKTTKALLSFRGDNASVSLIGISPENHEDLKSVIAKGRFLAGSDYMAAVVSHDIAEDFFRMDISPGNWIRLYLVEEDRYLDFKVVGVLEEDEDPSYGSETGIYITHRAMEALLDLEEYHYSTIVVRAEDSSKVDSLDEEIEDALSRVHRDEAYTVEPTATRLESMLEMMNMLKYALAGIGAISLIVGAIGISNVMMLAVRERTREIGVMKAIGAASRDIRYLFLLDAGILGLVSSLVGIALGAVVSGTVGSLAGLPSLVTMQSITVGLLFGTISTTIAGVYPASMAAKLDPIEALRAE